MDRIEGVPEGHCDSCNGTGHTEHGFKDCAACGGTGHIEQPKQIEAEDLRESLMDMLEQANYESQLVGPLADDIIEFFRYPISVTIREKGEK